MRAEKIGHHLTGEGQYGKIQQGKGEGWEEGGVGDINTEGGYEGVEIRKGTTETARRTRLRGTKKRRCPVYLKAYESGDPQRRGGGEETILLELWQGTQSGLIRS